MNAKCYYAFIDNQGDSCCPQCMITRILEQVHNNPFDSPAIKHYFIIGGDFTVATADFTVQWNVPKSIAIHNSQD